MLSLYAFLFWKYSFTKYFSGADVPGPVLDTKDTALHNTGTVYTCAELKSNLTAYNRID